jgi:glycosyltransferase involved in cell wall biosynthesis
MSPVFQPNTTKAPPFAIIIPCYNDGRYLPDALASVRRCEPSLYELIVVNDGSTDPETLQYLASLEQESVRVLHQTNQGMAAARNAGISATTAPYILPLDSDNMLRRTYLTVAKQIFENNPEVDVVYSDLEYFGLKSGIQSLPDPQLYLLLRSNYIDTCSPFRRSLWTTLCGFDEKREVRGIEDWDFWLRAMCRGARFRHITEPLFDYRVREGSVMDLLKKDKKDNTAIRYMHSKIVAVPVGDLIKETDHFAWWKSQFQQKPHQTLFLALTLWAKSLMTNIGSEKCASN